MNNGIPTATCSVSNTVRLPKRWNIFSPVVTLIIGGNPASYKAISVEGKVYLYIAQQTVFFFISRISKYEKDHFQMLCFNLREHTTLDPPLYALSWNLKNSHVFSGSF